MGIAIVVAALIVGFALFIGLTGIADNLWNMRVQLRVLNRQFAEYRLGVLPALDDDEPEGDA